MERRRRSEKSWTLELGASVSSKGVRFRVWAPKISSLSVRVVGKSRDILMVPEGDGFFTTFIKGLGPGVKYSYLLNGDQPRPDPVSRFQPEGVHGPSEVVDPNLFQWE